MSLYFGHFGSSVSTLTCNGGAATCVFQLRSFFRGYHAYLAELTPDLGEILQVHIELGYVYDRYAEALKKDGIVVGHLPREISRTAHYFLQCERNSIECEIVGQRVNRGRGLGLEVPCLYKFIGRKDFVENFLV